MQPLQMEFIERVYGLDLTPLVGIETKLYLETLLRKIKGIQLVERDRDGFYYRLIFPAKVSDEQARANVAEALQRFC